MKTQAITIKPKSRLGRVGYKSKPYKMKVVVGTCRGLV